MITVSWILDDYEQNQFYENPQLFETNISERFPKLENYQVIEVTPDKNLRLKVVVHTN